MGTFGGHPTPWLQTTLLPCLQQQGTPSLPLAPACPNVHICYLLMFGLQPSKYQGQLL